MTPTLERIVSAHGSFPETPAVLEGFDAVLRMAGSGRESAADVTEALLVLVDQLAEQSEPVPKEVGTRLTDWADRVAEDTTVPAEAIVALLVNAQTARSLKVLEALSAQRHRPDLAAAAAEGLAERHASDAP